MLALNKKFPLERIFLYGFAVSGQILQSVFHFGVSLLLIKLLPPAEFALYAFIFILLHLTAGLGNALINTPLSVHLQQNLNNQEQADLLELFSKINLYHSLISALTIGTLIFFWQKDIGLALNTALLTASFLWRHFARGVNFAERNPKGSTNCDLAYAGIGIFSILIILWVNHEALSLNITLLVLTLSCIFSLFFAKPGFATLQFVQFRNSQLRDYIPIWKNSSRWSLTGVLTTELTSNGYSYIIIFLSGPKAFAPIAAASILFRPISTLMLSLTSLERPTIAKQIADNNHNAKWHTYFRFIGILLAAWICLTVGISIAWPLIFDQIFINNYNEKIIITCIIFWAAIFLVRTIRTLPSLILQAQTKFKPLAISTIISAPISLLAVLLIFYGYGPVYSLIGLFIGEFCLLILILHKIQRREA